jgi:hypothetical protein
VCGEHFYGCDESQRTTEDALTKGANAYYAQHFAATHAWARPPTVGVPGSFPGVGAPQHWQIGEMMGHLPYNPNTRYGRNKACLAAQDEANRVGRRVYLQVVHGSYYVTSDGRGPLNLNDRWWEFVPSRVDA